MRKTLWLGIVIAVCITLFTSCPPFFGDPEPPSSILLVPGDSQISLS
jgi:hypothetical protein